MERQTPVNQSYIEQGPAAGTSSTSYSLIEMLRIGIFMNGWLEESKGVLVSGDLL